VKFSTGVQFAAILGITGTTVVSIQGGGPPFGQERPSATPTFARDVAPIIFRRCVACHHPDGAAPFSLVTYEDVRGRANLLAAVTKNRYMPPWKPAPGYGDFIGPRRLTNEEVDTIDRWVTGGALEGSAADLPRPPNWIKGWQLGTPDLIVRMPEPFELSPDGPDVFRTFVIPIPVNAARYVKALEFQPGTRAVHHATMLVDKTPASRRRDEEDPMPGYEGGFAPSADYPSGHFLGWAPGQLLPVADSETAWPLNPGTDLVVQLHLKPTGKPERVQVTVGLFFTSIPPSRTLSMLRLSRADIDIPAGERQHVVTDSYELPAAVDVLAVQPHAHYRATGVAAFATLPDGTVRWLISIPRWDFDWQDMYYLAEPLHLPKGTTLSMQFTFDNSAENPRNPQLPPKRVRWGQNSTDEMAELLLQVAPRSSSDLALLEHEFLRKHRRDVITGYQTRLSVTPDDVTLHDDIAELETEDGAISDAISHFREAIRLMPSAARHVNLGRALVAAGEIEQAATAFQRALQINATDVAARSNLGVVRALQGRVDEAVAQYERAIDIDPAYAEAHSNMSAALLYLGRTDEALDHARRALQLKSDFPAAHYNLARALLVGNRPQDAAQHFDLALRLRPGWPEVLKDYAWMLATHPNADARDPEYAIELAARAVELTNRHQPLPLDVLAAAYASVSRFDEAISTAQEALHLLSDPEDRKETADIWLRLALYREHKPYFDVLRRTHP
jgi:tetratricopeptide (TPR) repeat protein/mono/diheme cytochrome c family protein